MTDIGVMIGRAIIIGPVGILVLAFAIGGAPENEKSRNEASTVQTGRGDYGHATQTVANQTRDPDAAQFRNVLHTALCNGAVYVGGEMNAKNGFGAYTGYAQFSVKVQNGLANTVLMIEGKTAASDLAITEAARCVNQAAAEVERSRLK